MPVRRSQPTGVIRARPTPRDPASAVGIASQSPCLERISTPRSKASVISAARLKISDAAEIDFPDPRVAVGADRIRQPLAKAGAGHLRAPCRLQHIAGTGDADGHRLLGGDDLGLE